VSVRCYLWDTEVGDRLERPGRVALHERRGAAVPRQLGTMPLRHGAHRAARPTAAAAAAAAASLQRAAMLIQNMLCDAM
jgi:hypothetical protein